MATSETQVVRELGNEYAYGFHDPEEYFFKSGRGLSPEVVAMISEHKNEPAWMRQRRLKALEYFRARPLPEWGGKKLRIPIEDDALLMEHGVQFVHSANYRLLVIK